MTRVSEDPAWWPTALAGASDDGDEKHTKALDHPLDHLLGWLV